MKRCPPGFGLQSLAASEGFLRIAQAAIEQYGDIEEFMAYLAVLAAAAGAVSRDPVLSARFGGREPIPDENLRAVSARAVALSTGLSRETTRRKLAQLVADGHLVRTSAGIRPPRDVMAQRQNMKFARLIVSEILQTAKRIERIPQHLRAGAAAAKRRD